eukprot:Nk52_evm37s359 gene=Nk52_evmTU37s359
MKEHEFLSYSHKKEEGQGGGKTFHQKDIPSSANPAERPVEESAQELRDPVNAEKVVSGANSFSSAAAVDQNRYRTLTGASSIDSSSSGRGYKRSYSAGFALEGASEKNGEHPHRRSVVGSRVYCPYKDGFIYPATIAHVTYNGQSSVPVFVVEFGNGDKCELPGEMIFGERFKDIRSITKFNVGQPVWCLTANREGKTVEMGGSVVDNIESRGLVIIRLENNVVVERRLLEVRLEPSYERPGTYHQSYAYGSEYTSQPFQERKVIRPTPYNPGQAGRAYHSMSDEQAQLYDPRVESHGKAMAVYPRTNNHAPFNPYYKHYREHHHHHVRQTPDPHLYRRHPSSKENVSPISPNTINSAGSTPVSDQRAAYCPPPVQHHHLYHHQHHPAHSSSFRPIEGARVYKDENVAAALTHMGGIESNGAAASKRGKAAHGLSKKSIYRCVVNGCGRVLGTLGGMKRHISKSHFRPDGQPMDPNEDENCFVEIDGVDMDLRDFHYHPSEMGASALPPFSTQESVMRGHFKPERKTSVASPSDRPTERKTKDEGMDFKTDKEGNTVQLQKCRKRFGLARKSEWCSKCRWKKACERFL